MLNEKTDYDVTYPAGRKNIGSYSVTIQFKGNYEGTVNQTFKIVEKKNAIFTVKNNQYKITGASTVAFTGVKNSKTKKVTIPDTVTYGGKSFKVTSIADKALKKSALTSATIGKNVKTIGASAFEGCRKLNSVTVGKNVAKIGKNAFKGCKKLKLITIKSSKLKTVGSNAFKGIHSKAKIKVPAKKLSAYKKLMKGKGQGKKVTIVK